MVLRKAFVSAVAASSGVLLAGCASSPQRVADPQLGDRVRFDDGRLHGH